MLYSKTTRGFYDPEIHGKNIPADAVQVADADYVALMEGSGQRATIVPDENGYPVLQEDQGPSLDDEVAGLNSAVRLHLDQVAKSRGYDNIVSLCSYATSTVAKYAAEGQAGVEWRDAVWVKCYEVLAEVEAGLREQPTVEQLIAELPAFVWPD